MTVYSDWRRLSSALSAPLLREETFDREITSVNEGKDIVQKSMDCVIFSPESLMLRRKLSHIHTLV